MPVRTKGGRLYRTVWERLVDAHGDDYEPPVGITQIETEIVATQPFVVVKATVRFADGRSFSGLSEAKQDAPANTADGTNPIETAETSALGRALAFAGFYGSDSGIAGAEEMRTADRTRSLRERMEAGPTPQNGHAAREFSKSPEGQQTVKESPRSWYERMVPHAVREGYKRATFTDDAPEEFVVAECRKLKTFLEGVKATAERAR